MSFCVDFLVADDNPACFQPLGSREVSCLGGLDREAAVLHDSLHRIQELIQFVVAGREGHVVRVSRVCDGLMPLLDAPGSPELKAETRQTEVQLSRGDVAEHGGRRGSLRQTASEEAEA